MTINDFLSKVDSTIKKYSMADQSQTLLVGFSGGADSTALLVSLKELGYNVKACHINHCLRGEESLRDERFCTELCERLGIEISVSRIDVKSYCQVNSLSIEEGARNLRYEIFAKTECDRICTAHNLNDCFETAIFNLARGSGLKGLASIPPVRDNVIRPLIECTRAEIEEFLGLKGESFVTDSTNLEDEYTRNKIRHNVLPVLTQVNSSLYKTFANTVSYLREDSRFLEKLADEELEKCRCEKGYDCCKVKQLDSSIRHRVIMRILGENNLSVSTDRIGDLERLVNSGGKVNLSRNLFAVSDGEILRLEYLERKGKSPCESVAVGKNDGEYDFCGRKISFIIKESDGKFENVHKKFANYCLDCDKIIGEIILRNRAEGDKIRLVNRDFTSDVRKLFKSKYSAEERGRAFVLADDGGVIFAEGFGAAERVRIDGDTRRVLLIDVS